MLKIKTKFDIVTDVLFDIVYYISLPAVLVVYGALGLCDMLK